MSQRFDPTLKDDIEEEYGPGPVVGRVKPCLEQCERADEALHLHGGKNRVHLYPLVIAWCKRGGG
jgi:hypothetical protein